MQNYPKINYISFEINKFALRLSIQNIQFDLTLLKINEYSKDTNISMDDIVLMQEDYSLD